VIPSYNIALVRAMISCGCARHVSGSDPSPAIKSQVLMKPIDLWAWLVEFESKKDDAAGAAALLSPGNAIKHRLTEPLSFIMIELAQFPYLTDFARYLPLNGEKSQIRSIQLLMELEALSGALSTAAFAMPHFPFPPFPSQLSLLRTANEMPSMPS
jgi:hypothetical protein